MLWCAMTKERAVNAQKGKDGLYATPTVKQKQIFRVETSKVVAKAVEYCRETGFGAKEAMKTGKFPGIKWHQVDKALRKKNLLMVRTHHHQIMINDERSQLATHLIEAADAGTPLSRVEISKLVVKVLKARHVDNKRKNFRCPQAHLNVHERGVLATPTQPLSNRFFRSYYAWCFANGIKINEGTCGDSGQDEKRKATMTNATVTRHFYSPEGLEQEFIRLGIMHADEKVI